MAADRRKAMPMSAQRFLPSFTGRRRRPTDAGEELALDTGAAVLRATRGAVETMRLADAAGRRAHTERDLAGFDAAWRSYHDAEQLYRHAAAQWESVIATRSSASGELPFAPVWSSNDLETEHVPFLIDLSVDAPTDPEPTIVVLDEQALDAEVYDAEVHESR
jgi:hypothetical protein